MPFTPLICAIDTFYLTFQFACCCDACNTIRLLEGRCARHRRRHIHRRHRRRHQFVLENNWMRLLNSNIICAHGKVVCLRSHPTNPVESFCSCKHRRGYSTSRNSKRCRKLKHVTDAFAFLLFNLLTKHRHTLCASTISQRTNMRSTIHPYTPIERRSETFQRLTSVTTATMSISQKNKMRFFGAVTVAVGFCVPVAMAQERSHRPWQSQCRDRFHDDAAPSVLDWWRRNIIWFRVENLFVDVHSTIRRIFCI